MTGLSPGPFLVYTSSLLNFKCYRGADFPGRRRSAAGASGRGSRTHTRPLVCRQAARTGNACGTSRIPRGTGYGSSPRSRSTRFRSPGRWCRIDRRSTGSGGFGLRPFALALDKPGRVHRLASRAADRRFLAAGQRNRFPVFSVQFVQIAAYRANGPPSACGHFHDLVCVFKIPSHVHNITPYYTLCQAVTHKGSPAFAFLPPAHR